MNFLACIPGLVYINDVCWRYHDLIISPLVGATLIGSFLFFLCHTKGGQVKLSGEIAVSIFCHKNFANVNSALHFFREEVQ